MIERALHYREVLRSNVLPVGKPEFGNKETGKRTICKWKVFEGVLQTRSDIKRLFNGHEENLAMMVGTPNLFVSWDIDSVEAREWADAKLPETPLVFSTGREGGEQRLYKAPEIEMSSRLGKHGGDFKGTGYIIIPPSRHYLGRQYKWREEPTRELVEQTPVWPVNAIVEEKMFPEALPIKMTSDVREALAMTAGYVRRIEPINGGSAGRDNAAFRAACKIRDRLAHLGLLPEDCLELFEKEFNARCDPAWSEEEAIHKLRDAWKKKGF